MKKFLLSLMIVIMLGTSVNSSVLAAPATNEETVICFFQDLENEKELLMMVQLLFLIEDQQGIQSTYNELFEAVAVNEGNRFNELDQAVKFIISFTDEFVNSREDYYALENALENDEVETYVKGLNLSRFNDQSLQINSRQLNKFTQLLNKTATFKSYGITFPIMTVTENYEESVVDYELLESLAGHADRLVGQETSMSTTQYETLLICLVEHYNNFFNEADMKDKKIMAAYMKKYGLVTITD